MAAIALGIGAAVCWGLADFLGGLRARTLTLAAILLVSQFARPRRRRRRGAHRRANRCRRSSDVAPALVAGVAQLVGIAALYRALAIGTMSVISPISASGAAALPVIVGIAAASIPAAVQLAGMAIAFRRRHPRHPQPGPVGGPRLARGAPAQRRCGARLRGLLRRHGRRRRLGRIRSGRCWSPAPRRPRCWSLCSRRCDPASATVPAVLPALVLIGLLDVGANACFTLGTDTGLLSVVAVLASLYPVTTVVLARGCARRAARRDPGRRCVTWRSPASPLIAAG